MDYSQHPEYPHLTSCKASAHIPEWRKTDTITFTAPKPTATESAKKPAMRTSKAAAKKAVSKAETPLDKTAAPTLISNNEVPAASANIVPADKNSIMS